MVVKFDMPKFHTACEKVVPVHELHTLPAVIPKLNETLSIICITASSEKLSHLKALTKKRPKYRVSIANACKVRFYGAQNGSPTISNKFGAAI